MFCCKCLEALQAGLDEQACKVLIIGLLSCCSVFILFANGETWSDNVIVLMTMILLVESREGVLC
jgi:hypothetical protein